MASPGLYRASARPRVRFRSERGLDKIWRKDKITSSKRCFMQTACEHTRTQIIARRDGIDYVECLDCHQIFEAEDLEPVKVEEEEE
jgi:hypothetical protein